MSEDAAPVPAPANEPKATKAAKQKAPKAAGDKKDRKKFAHPPASDLVVQAIAALKERSGSSLQAIKKYIAQQHKGMAAGWEKRVNAAVRILTEKGKLVKTKGHFKIAAAAKKADKKPKTPKPAGEKKAKVLQAESEKKTKKAPAKVKADGEKKKKAPAKPKTPKAKAPAKPKAAATKKAAKPKTAKPAAKKATKAADKPAAA
eukprot:GHRR01004175.1.p1 GENE.GHRR01004175.1~~GHRR01004175.1.p1  ORF type:complete len:203 (+),score=90.36 GHRR01004175.1:167-775(+)